jgi:hypothetical protein
MRGHFMNLASHYLIGNIGHKTNLYIKFETIDSVVFCFLSPVLQVIELLRYAGCRHNSIEFDRGTIIEHLRL